MLMGSLACKNQGGVSLARRRPDGNRAVGLRKEIGVMARFVLTGESGDYRRGREELLAAEIALKDQVERVAALRAPCRLG
jgi:hypothetical protein